MTGESHGNRRSRYGIERGRCGIERNRCGIERGRCDIERIRSRWRTGGAAATWALLFLVLLPEAVVAQSRLVILPESRGTIVAVTLLMRTGPLPASDGASAAYFSAGSACVAGNSIIHELLPQLNALGARATVRCMPTRLGFTLLARPVTWRVATDFFLTTLFEQRVGNRSIRRARDSALRRLAAECDNPGYRLRLRLRLAFYGAGFGEEAACGANAADPGFTPDRILQFMRARFLPGRAAAAVAGPVDPAAAHDLLARALGSVRTPVPAPLPVPRPEPERHIVASNTITAQIGMMLPLPGRPDMEAVELLAFALERQLAPGPARRDIYSSTVEVRRREAAGTLAIYLVTETNRASYWADRVQALIEEFAAGPVLSQARFRALLGRYRGDRLLGMAAPEDRALDAARQAIFGARYRAPASSIDTLSPGRLRNAARSLGAATTVIMRPSS